MNIRMYFTSRIEVLVQDAQVLKFGVDNNPSQRNRAQNPGAQPSPYHARPKGVSQFFLGGHDLGIRCQCQVCFPKILILI